MWEAFPRSAARQQEAMWEEGRKGGEADEIYICRLYRKGEGKS